MCHSWCCCISELAKEEAEGHPFRGGAITPDGLIDEDFEEELGSPAQEVSIELWCLRSASLNRLDMTLV